MNAPKDINVAAAAQFLQAIGGSTKFTFLTMGEGTLKRSMRPHEVHGTFAEVQPCLIRSNQAGAGIFVTINETDLRGRKEGNITRVRALFVDLDGASVEPVEKWDLKPHLIIESSPGRWHAYWLVEAFPLARFREAQQALAARFNGDKAICDLPRVMRVPGFFHCKGEPRMVVIKTVHPNLAPYKTEHIVAALGLPSGKRTSASMGSDCMFPGERNSTLTRIAGGLRRTGRSFDQINEELQRLNFEKCSPPLELDEVGKIAKSVSRYPEFPTEIVTTDTGNSQRFVERHCSQLRYVPEMKKWLLWNGQCWEVDNIGRAMECAKETARSIYIHASNTASDSGRLALAKHAGRSLNRARLQAMVSLAESEPRIIARMAELNKDDFLIGTQNGVVDLRNGEFRASQREDMITQRCGTNFDSTAECPTFKRFLDRVTGGDTDLQGYLQRLVGYALTGDTREHCLAFLYGQGANGKSTFLDALMRLLGDYASQTQPETLMARRSGGANNDLARLAGKRLVVSNEVSEGAHLEENLVKQLVGGDVVTARFLFQEHFEFKPKLKLLIAGNHHPVIKGDDDGIWRRIHLVPFVHVVPENERDKQLGEKLALELPGILNWAIAGCLDWQTRGLDAPHVITSATTRYRAEMDLLGAWIEQECDVGAACRYSSRLLYDNYREWCERCGVRPLSSMTFVRKLDARQFRKEHTRSGNFVRGLQLRASALSRLSLAA